MYFLSTSMQQAKKKNASRWVAFFTLFSCLSSSVYAGGFAVREQSTVGMGAAFAGVAAGSGPSSIYWNGATISNTTGLETESNYTVALPDATMTSTADGEVDIGTLGLLSSSAVAYQYNDQVFLGFSLSAPLGFKTRADKQNFSGAQYGRKSSVFSINANPVVAYKMSPTLTVSAGAQIEYLSVKLHSAIGAPAGPMGSIEGDDIGFGVTAGVMYQPSENTSIGLGYRSAISHDLEGKFYVGGNLNSKIKADFTSPDLVTFSVKQKVSPAVTLMGTIEWSNWSSFKELNVKNPAGTTLVQTDFLWKDSWFYSVGAEYEWNDKWTLRTGLAYEESPVPDSTRSVRLPDSNRLWLSMGASYKWSEATTVNLAFTHIAMEDTKIDLPAYKADVETTIDIISVGFKTKW